MTLPITYGRYHTPIAKALESVRNRKSTKSYMYNCGTEVFNNAQLSVANKYTPVQITGDNVFQKDDA